MDQLEVMAIKAALHDLVTQLKRIADSLEKQANTK